MNFLLRFIKIYLFALVISALGAFVFYKMVIEGSRLRSDVSYDEFLHTVYLGIGAWVGFVTALCLLLAFIGMRKSVTVPVYDRNLFLHKLNHVLTGMRYRPHQQSPNHLSYKGPALAFLAEKISVQLEQNSAVITAPRGLLRKIQGRL